MYLKKQGKEEEEKNDLTRLCFVFFSFFFLPVNVYSVSVYVSACARMGVCRV